MNLPAEKKEPPKPETADNKPEAPGPREDEECGEVTGIIRVALAAMDDNLKGKKAARASARRAITASTLKAAEVAAEALKK